MGPHVIFRLLKQNLLWFILIPGIAAGVVFYLTRGEAKAYKSQAMLYTGLASGYSVQSLVPNNLGDRSSIAFDNLLDDAELDRNAAADWRKSADRTPVAGPARPDGTGPGRV